MTVLEPAEPGDLAAVARIAERAFAPYVERIGRPPAPMHDDHAAHLARGHLDVVRDGGRPVAYVVSHADDGSLHLTTIAVDPDRQGTGLGAALMAAVEERARARGLDRIELYTNRAMVENVAWYERLGFVVTHHREGTFARTHMRKRLD